MSFGQLEMLWNRFCRISHEAADPPHDVSDIFGGAKKPDDFHSASAFSKASRPS